MIAIWPRLRQEVICIKDLYVVLEVDGDGDINEKLQDFSRRN